MCEKSEVSTPDETKWLMKLFLEFLNERTDTCVVTGGAALMTCYQSERFIDTLRLDCMDIKPFQKIVKDFYYKYDYTPVPYTERLLYFGLYKKGRTHLRFEVEERSEEYMNPLTSVIDGIRTYNIDHICYWNGKKFYAYGKKIYAYDKIGTLYETLYDIAYICKKYWDDLSVGTIRLLKRVFSIYGLAYCYRIIDEQENEYIDKVQMRHDVCDMFKKLSRPYYGYDEYKKNRWWD